MLGFHLLLTPFANKNVTFSRGWIFFGRNPDTSTPLQLCLGISFSSNSRNLLHISSNSCILLRISTVQLLYTVTEKGEKTYSKPYPLFYVLRNPNRNLGSENSQDYAQKLHRNSTFMNSASGQGMKWSSSPKRQYYNKLYIWFIVLFLAWKHCSWMSGWRTRYSTKNCTLEFAR